MNKQIMFSFLIILQLIITNCAAASEKNCVKEQSFTVCIPKCAIPKPCYKPPVCKCEFNQAIADKLIDLLIKACNGQIDPNTAINTATKLIPQESYFCILKNLGINQSDINNINVRTIDLNKIEAITGLNLSRLKKQDSSFPFIIQKYLSKNKINY